MTTWRTSTSADGKVREDLCAWGEDKKAELNKTPDLILNPISKVKGHVWAESLLDQSVVAQWDVAWCGVELHANGLLVAHTSWGRGTGSWWWFSLCLKTYSVGRDKKPPSWMLPLQVETARGWSWEGTREGIQWISLPWRQKPVRALVVMV